MSAQNAVVERRIADLEASDTLLATNDTGRTLYHNEIITIAAGTNKGMVGIVDSGSVGGTVAANAQYNLIHKGIFEVPAAAASFTLGCDVQYVPSAASVTTGATATGTYGMGKCVLTAASSAGYVKVDLNSGPTAFYVW